MLTTVKYYMKLTINQNENIKETEIIINCRSFDERVSSLISYLRQYSASIECMIDDSGYYVPLESVLYIESVDKKTFVYDVHNVYETMYTLKELEAKLENTSFMRISRSCIVNMAYVQAVSPGANHRIEISMTNGEHLIAARSYRDEFRKRLKIFKAEAFHIQPPPVKAVIEHDWIRSVYNDGRVIDFPACPRRTVTMSLGYAELFAALSIENTLIGIVPDESSIDNVLAQYRELLINIPLITQKDQGVLTAGDLKALGADLVVGDYYALRCAEDNNSGSVSRLGINFYVCEGTIPGRATVDSVYKDILNIGRIFRVEDRSIELVACLRNHIAGVARILKKDKKVRVFVYDSGEGAPVTAMGDALENDIISAAGGENIFSKTEGTYQKTSWDEVVKKDPEAIIIHDYKELRTFDEKAEILRSLPDAGKISAIKNERFIRLSMIEVFPGIQIGNTVEKLFRCFYPELV